MYLPMQINLHLLILPHLCFTLHTPKQCYLKFKLYLETVFLFTYRCIQAQAVQSHSYPNYRHYRHLLMQVHVLNQWQSKQQFSVPI